MKVRIFVCLLLLSMLSLEGVAADCALLPKPRKLSDHAYAWIGPLDGPNKKNRGYRMNLGFVVGDRAVAVIDSGFYRAMGEAMLCRIRQVTALPVKYVINTNSQPHRFFGNDAFKAAGAGIYAHQKEIDRMTENEEIYRRMVSQSVGLSEVKPPVAAITPVTKKTKLSLGGVTVVIDFYKAAHTPSPLMVYIPEDHVVYAGDILYGQRLLAIVSGGSIKEWIESFGYLQKQYKGALFVPGHGKPGPLSAFKHDTLDYLNLLRGHMKKMVEAEVGLQQAIKKLDQSSHAGLANFEALAGRNANRAYLEMEQELF